jgi:hypothetical protein
MRFRQFLWSLGGFALLLAALIALDQRVREQFERLVYGGDGLSSWDNRLMALGDAVMIAFRYQSLENGPMLAFAAVGAVLFLFMVRT